MINCNDGLLAGLIYKRIAGRLGCHNDIVCELSVQEQVYQSKYFPSKLK